MARKLRLEFPGTCYHVINRGNWHGRLRGAALMGRFFVPYRFEDVPAEALQLAAQN